MTDDVLYIINYLRNSTGLEIRPKKKLPFGSFFPHSKRFYDNLLFRPNS